MLRLRPRHTYLLPSVLYRCPQLTPGSISRVALAPAVCPDRAESCETAKAFSAFGENEFWNGWGGGMGGLSARFDGIVGGIDAVVER